MCSSPGWGTSITHEHSPCGCQERASWPAWQIFLLLQFNLLLQLQKFFFLKKGNRNAEVFYGSVSVCGSAQGSGCGVGWGAAVCHPLGKGNKSYVLRALDCRSTAKDSLAAPCASGKVLPGYSQSREGRMTPGFLVWSFLSNWLFWFFPTCCSERLFLKKILWFSPSDNNLLDGAQLPSVSLLTGVIKWCCRLASALMQFFNYLLSVEGWFQWVVGTLWGEQKRRNVLLLNVSSSKGLIWPGRSSLGKVWWTWRQGWLGKGLWPWQGVVRVLGLFKADLTGYFPHFVSLCSFGYH